MPGERAARRRNPLEGGRAHADPCAHGGFRAHRDARQPDLQPRNPGRGARGLHACYPEETRLSVYGTSCLGQPLYAMEIGNPEATTRVLVQAGMHGREWINVQILMAQIEDYLAKDMYDPMLERASFLFVPMSNPDGVRSRRRARPGSKTRPTAPWSSA